jgi:hypothetical protein
MMFGGTAGGASQNTVPGSSQGSIYQYDGHRTGSPGQCRNGFFKYSHIPGFQQAVNGYIDDLTGGLTGYDHAGPHLAQLYGIGHLNHSV